MTVVMFSDRVVKLESLTDTQEVRRDRGRLIARKIWLPKALYNLLPYFYLVSGFSALLATLYISNWLWVVPHYLLFSIACLHMGALVYWRRHRR
ncbi:MAG: hypothetical protein OEM85_12410 [Gammaproteobacteria bacterium]|nr:hypothetical protein [Gammaproteobacteria bacterium]MDH3409840.1 hypothetical protein [Gammaproteobacteria bacterium]